MKTLTNIQFGKLNEFENFFHEVQLINHGSSKILSLIEREISEQIREMEGSPEFWWAEFTYEDKQYVITGDGEFTSSGKYIVAEIIEEDRVN